MNDTMVPMPTVNQADREGFAAFLLRMRGEGIENRALMTAIEAIPRRGFVSPEFHRAVWGRRSIPIDYGEVIEGLDVQARMIDMLRLEERHRVLEIGTGSGFSAAVIAKLAKRVYTIERFRGLQKAAAHRFRELKLDNVIAIHGDGSSGSKDGPFDRIVVWGAFNAVPRVFIDQLVSGGEMICAIGEADTIQTIVRLTKVGSRFDREDLGVVRFQRLAHGTPSVL